MIWFPSAQTWSLLVIVILAFCGIALSLEPATNDTTELEAIAVNTTAPAPIIEGVPSNVKTTSLPNHADAHAAHDVTSTFSPAIGTGPRMLIQRIQRCEFEPAVISSTSSHKTFISFRSSPIFDIDGGFGELPAVERPITKGVFAKYRLQFGTGAPPNNTEHGIERGIDATMIHRLTEGAVAAILSLKTFEAFRIELEGKPITPEPKVHDSGHRVVGGDMGNTYSSPGG
ncbi:hypothetical protein H0H87_012009 [Tephrocybe sp. NHM501043]|nr:hypothetical protein H0H87_012009 [Tephrocybe sp. NHM501043]